MNEAARKQVAETGIMPLDYMLEILRNEDLPAEDRFEAAKAAAPYVHARLTATENTHKGPDGGPMTVTWLPPQDK